MSHTIGCSNNTVSVCRGSPCKSSSCSSYDNAVCEVDSCSNCTVKYYVGLQEVSSQCGKYLIS